jgi:beta-lactamase regulating signal transducer with metallopeptidase domain
MFSGLRQIVWADAQAALWAVLFLIAGLVISTSLRKRLPVWRKGVWLIAILLPPLLVAVASLLPRQAGRWVLTDWISKPVALSSSVESSGHAYTSAGLLYLSWVAINLIVELGASLRLRRLLANSVPFRRPSSVAVYTQLVKSMGCTRAPLVVESADVASPFIAARLTGGLVIILPESLCELADGSAAMRAVLAHELAHARAGDPYVQRLLGLLRCFLPLTWLCSLMVLRNFWEDAAEQTGDIRAVRGSGLADREYAAVLKDFALGQMPGLSALAFSGQTSSLSPSTRDLADRLIGRLGALKLASKWSEALPAGIASCVRGSACGAILLFLAVYSPLRNVLEDPRPTSLQPQPIAQLNSPQPLSVPAESDKSALPRDPKPAPLASANDSKRRKQAERKSALLDEAAAARRPADERPRRADKPGRFNKRPTSADPVTDMS